MEGCVTQKWVALSHNTWGAEDGGGCLRYLCFVFLCLALLGTVLRFYLVFLGDKIVHKKMLNLC